MDTARWTKRPLVHAGPQIRLGAAYQRRLKAAIPLFPTSNLETRNNGVVEGSGLACRPLMN
jgi:hypothetical protein